MLPHNDSPLLGALALVTVLLLLWAAIRHTRARTPKPLLPPGGTPLGDGGADSSGPIAASVTAPPEVPKTPPGKPPPARERRHAIIRQRVSEGLCVHCPEPARRQRPVIRPKRPLFDVIYHALGVVPVDRWRVVTQRDPSVPYALCEWHQTVEQRVLERRVAAFAVANGDHALAQSIDAYELETHGVDEHVQAEMAVISARKPEDRPARTAPNGAASNHVQNGTN